MLRAENITVHLGPRRIINGASLTVNDRDMIAVVGPNGSGKSTLIRTLAGILAPRSGRVTLDDHTLRTWPRRKLARRLGMLAQSAETPALTTVRDHVGLGRHAHRTIFRGDPRADALAIQSAMHRCEIDHLAQRRVDQLSGGERQRVRLATLLAQNPGILLLDEPLTGLDIEHQLSLLELLRRLNAEDGRAVVCVLHDLDLALRYFPRIIVLHDGRIVGDGPPAHVLCPRLFASVFRVEGRLGREQSGEPIVCTRPLCAESCGEPGPPPPMEVRIRPDTLHAAVERPPRTAERTAP